MSFSTTTDKVGPLTLASYSTPLAVTFPFQNKSDLLVLNIGPSATPYATAVTLTFNADYTVDGGGYNSNYDMQTGTVTVIRYGPHDVQINDRLVIVRNSPQNQLTSFLTNGLLTVAMIEAALDKGVTLTQAVEREVLHTLRIPYTESNLAEMTKTQRAGSVIAFDTDGNLSFTYGTTYYNGVAANAAAAAASATASQSSAVASATSAGNSASSATAAAGSATAAANSASQAAAVIPSQSGHAGQFLQTDGSATSWAAAGTGTVTSVGLSGGTTGLTASNTPVTTSGTITLGGTLAVANGGTGGTTAATARTNLGLGSIATQTASSVAITGGAIDGTTIGATTATTGKFTGVTATRTDGNYQYTSASATKTYGIATSGTTFLLDDVTASATRFAIDSAGNPSFSSLSTNGIVKATGSAGILTTAAAVSIATEVSGLGTGIATFLGTPTSANLSAAVTDESGTGNLLFSVSPAMTGTPTVPTAAAGDNTTKAASTAYVQANRGDKYLTTSTSTNTIDNGNAKTFNCDTGLSYIATQPVTVVYDINNHMHCTVVSYSSSTGAMVVNSDSHSGSGTYSAWTINIGGLTSASGALLSANNLSDVASAATSATNLGLGAASAATLGSLTLASSPLPVTSGGTGVTTSTGTGAVVRATSPTLVTPALGTPSALVGTNITGTASGLTAGNVTTNANLTGDVTSVGNATTLTNAPVIAKVLTGYTSGAGTVAATDSILQAIQKLNGNDATNANLTGVITSVGNTTSIASQTGTGTKFVVDTSPTLVTPNLGTPSAVVLTSATGLPLATGVTGTLPIANGGTGAATLAANNVLLGNGTSAVQVVAPGSSGNVLMSNGTTWASTAPTGGGNVSSTGTPTSGQAAEWTSASVIQGVTVTGSGNYVKATSPTLVTPVLGTPTSGVATNLTGLPLTTGVTGTLPAANGGTGVANNAAMTVTGSGNFAYTRTLTAATNVTFPTTGTLATLAGSETLTNKTLTSPTLTTPALGTPASGVVTNLTGTASININGAVGATTPSTVAATTLNASALTTIASSAFITGRSIPSSGAGLEIFYSSNLSYLISYDRTNSAFKALSFDGTTVSINVSGSQVGQFTSTGLAVTGSITPSQTAGIVGTTTNNNANAGSVGEYLNQITASGSAVALTTATQHNIATITLTAGDWDVGGTICFSFGSGAAIVWTRSCINNSSASITQDQKTTSITTTITGGTIDASFAVPTTRWSVSTNTQVWLVTQTSFSGTLSGYGNLWARRAR